MKNWNKNLRKFYKKKVLGVWIYFFQAYVPYDFTKYAILQKSDLISKQWVVFWVYYLYAKHTFEIWIF